MIDRTGPRVQLSPCHKACDYFPSHCPLPLIVVFPRYQPWGILRNICTHIRRVLWLPTNSQEHESPGGTKVCQENMDMRLHTGRFIWFRSLWMLKMKRAADDLLGSDLGSVQGKVVQTSNMTISARLLASTPALTKPVIDFDIFDIGFLPGVIVVQCPL